MTVSVAVRLPKRYVHLYNSISIVKTHLTFNKTYKELRLIPKSLRLKRLVCIPPRIVEKTERRLLHARIQECCETVRKYLDLFFLRIQLECRAPEQFYAIDDFARSAATSASERRSSDHKMNLVSLQWRPAAFRGTDERFVENLTSRALSDAETHVLAKGKELNLTTTTLLISQSMAAAVEYGLRELVPCICEEARLKAIGVLSKAHRREQLNYTPEEKAAIRT